MTLTKNIILVAGFILAGSTALHAQTSEACANLEDAVIEVYGNCMESVHNYTCEECLEITVHAMQSWVHQCTIDELSENDNYANALRRLAEIAENCSPAQE